MSVEARRKSTKKWFTYIGACVILKIYHTYSTLNIYLTKQNNEHILNGGKDDDKQKNVH